MTPVRSRRRKRSRRETSRIWLVVLGILSGCAITLAIVYSPPMPRTEEVFQGLAPAGPGASGPVPDTVSVIVYNGIGTAGKASEVQRYLAGRSGTVFFTAPANPGDADRFNYNETVVVSHLPDIAAALAVAERLGIPDSNIVWSIPLDGTPQVDVSVYLGRDLANRAFMPFTPN